MYEYLVFDSDSNTIVFQVLMEELWFLDTSARDFTGVFIYVPIYRSPFFWWAAVTGDTIFFVWDHGSSESVMHQPQSSPIHS